MPKPARIVGNVPPDYDGPIYFRIRGSGESAPRYLESSPIVFKPPTIGQALATAGNIQIAHRMSDQVFDEHGKLLPQFQKPLQGRFRSEVPATIPEWSVGLFFYILVSPRVREVIEAFEPAKNLFLPVDVERKGTVERHYLFYVQLDHIAAPLAFRANGVEPRISDKGNPFSNNWHDHLHGQNRFIYVNSVAIGNRQVYHSAHAGVFLSAAIVQELGDVLPPDLAFSPMGVVHEFYDAPAFMEAQALQAQLSG